MTLLNNRAAMALVKIVAVLMLALSPAQTDSLQAKLNNIVRASGGTVGVAVSAMDDITVVSLNNDRRFPMQSVYKFHLALSVLHTVDGGELQLDQQILVKRNELLPKTWSPMRDDHPTGDVTLPLSKLLWYAVSISDNNACDVLFRIVGGPRAVQSYIRSLGADSVAIVSTEEEMHKESSLQFENWSAPSSAAYLLKQLHNGKILSEQSRTFLLNVMTETVTGPKRLKGMLPPGGIVAHKTGSSGRGADGITAAINDIGIITLPNGRSVAVAVFITNTPDDDAKSERVIAEIAKAVWDHYSAQP
jgi:beta-lactamase class A